MKHPRVLSLFVLSMALAMALTGSAAATTLTSPSGTTYTGAIRLENASRISITSEFGGFGAFACEVWIHEFKVETHGPTATAAGKNTTADIYQCSPLGGMTLQSAGSFEIHSTATTGDGTLTWSGLKFILDNTAVGSCSFEPPPFDLGTLTGSNTTKGKAKINFSTAIPVGPGNPFCGSKATLEGSFVVASPSTLEVH